jgi:uncharacterized membrane protein
VSDVEKSTISRGERSVAFMIAAIVGLSLVAFIVIIVATAVGVKEFNGGIWPTVFYIPYIGLPIAFVLFIVLMVLSIRRRRREARGSE